MALLGGLGRFWRFTEHLFDDEGNDVGAVKPV
jgi:hypothetical protein